MQRATWWCVSLWVLFDWVRIRIREAKPATHRMACGVWKGVDIEGFWRRSSCGEGR
jgi:hypothetical protein